MNSKNKKIIKERMFTMNLKNKKIFSRIAAGVMTVAMAITLLPGTMKTVNAEPTAPGTAAKPVESASLDVTLYKRAKVYAPNTTFEFTVTKSLVLVYPVGVTFPLIVVLKLANAIPV